MRSSVAVAPSGLIGRICVIRTDRLRRNFGLAEVRAGDGASVFIEVRLVGRADGAAGWSALIYDYDATGRYYWVVPLDVARF